MATDDIKKRARRVRLTVEELATLISSLSPVMTSFSEELRALLMATFNETLDPEFQRIADAYRTSVTVKDGEIELDDDAEVSIGEDPGAYVMVWTWVSAEDAGLCRTCSAPYSDGGDGFDGECPDCADKTEAAQELICERCTDKTTIGESPDGYLCPDCHDFVHSIPDEDEEISCTEEGHSEQPAWVLK